MRPTPFLLFALLIACGDSHTRGDDSGPTDPSIDASPDTPREPRSDAGSDMTPDPLTPPRDAGPLESCEGPLRSPRLEVTAESVSDVGCTEHFEGRVTAIQGEPENDGIVFDLDLSGDLTTDCRLHVAHCGWRLFEDLDAIETAFVLGGYQEGNPGFAFLFERDTGFYCDGFLGTQYVPFFFAGGSTRFEALPPDHLGLAVDVDHDFPTCHREGPCVQSESLFRGSFVTRSCEVRTGLADVDLPWSVDHDGRRTTLRTLTRPGLSSCPDAADPDIQHVEDHDGAFVVVSIPL